MIKRLLVFSLLLIFSVLPLSGSLLFKTILGSHGQVNYGNGMHIFGNTEVGPDIGHLSSDMWGSFFKCPEDGYAKTISPYVKTQSKPGRLRGALYEEFVFKPAPPAETKYMRYVMATEEKIVPPYFEGRVRLGFTAQPPTKKDVVYWTCAWSDEYSGMTIAQDRTTGRGIEWTVYMAGDPHGLGYPRFYEIVPQHRRVPILCSIYCEYDYTPPTTYACPYCGAPFSSYEEVLQHIMTTPTEMIHYYICDKCGYVSAIECLYQAHMYMYHSIGVKPTECRCIFCNHTVPITVGIPGPPVDYATQREVLRAIAEQTSISSHINDVHPGPGPAPEEGGENVVSVTLEFSGTLKGTKTFDVKFLVSKETPKPDEGYTLMPTSYGDILFAEDLIGKLWIEYKEVA